MINCAENNTLAVNVLFPKMSRRPSLVSSQILNQFERYFDHHDDYVSPTIAYRIFEIEHKIPIPPARFGMT